MTGLGRGPWYQNEMSEPDQHERSGTQCGVQSLSGVRRTTPQASPGYTAGDQAGGRGCPWRAGSGHSRGNSSLAIYRKKKNIRNNVPGGLGVGAAEAIQAWLYTGRKKISGITRIRYFAVRRSNYKYKKKKTPKTD